MIYMYLIIVLFMDVNRNYKITNYEIWISRHTPLLLYVCLLVSFLPSISRILCWNVDTEIIADEELQIKTYAKCSWPLNSRSYLARYVYFTGNRVLNLLPITNCNWHYLFQRLRLDATEIRTNCRHHRCSSHCSFYTHDWTIEFSSRYCIQKHDLLYFRYYLNQYISLDDKTI